MAGNAEDMITLTGAEQHLGDSNLSGGTAVVNASVGSSATRGRPGAIAGDPDGSTGFGVRAARAVSSTARLRR